MENQQTVGAEHVSLGSPSLTPAQQGTPATKIPDPKGKSPSRKLWPWQTALVQRSPKRDAEHLYWFCGLCQALGLVADGTAAAMALGAAATAFHIHAKFYEIDDSGNEPAIPYDEIIPVLVEGGYNGHLSSEYEGQRHIEDAFPVDAREQVRRQHAMFERLLAAHA